MSDQERNALIDKIIQSEWLIRAKSRTRLLKYLAREDRAVSVKELADTLFAHRLKKGIVDFCGLMCVVSAAICATASSYSVNQMLETAAVEVRVARCEKY